jgi:hypothetical protein
MFNAAHEDIFRCSSPDRTITFSETAPLGCISLIRRVSSFLNHLFFFEPIIPPNILTSFSCPPADPQKCLSNHLRNVDRQPPVISLIDTRGPLPGVPVRKISSSPPSGSTASAIGSAFRILSALHRQLCHIYRVSHFSEQQLLSFTDTINLKSDCPSFSERGLNPRICSNLRKKVQQCCRGTQKHNVTITASDSYCRSSRSEHRKSTVNNIPNR